MVQAAHRPWGLAFERHIRAASLGLAKWGVNRRLMTSSIFAPPKPDSRTAMDASVVSARFDVNLENLL